MSEQPAGTVTLVFTDIEGSTRLLGELGQDAYARVLADHREAVRGAFARFGGYEVDYEGDSFFYAFGSAADAVLAVEDAMAGLEGGPVRIRVGVHTGEPGLDPPKYVGLDVHRAARIMAAGHGGQVLLSDATRRLIGDRFALRDLGEHRLKDIQGLQRLYQLGEREHPPLRSVGHSNLPSPATEFLGRERELSEIVGLLRGGVRLLTLTGPGGTGKTRLGVQAALETAAEFGDGVCWVPLASVRDPSLVLPEIAKALGVGDTPGRDLGEAMKANLAGRRVLLVVDNTEHLLPEAAIAIAGLVTGAGPVILVTSRERLQIAGEHVFAVPPLDGAEGIELFAARVRSLDLGFQATPEVAELCAGLDNLPLALELAAARTALLSPAQILERLSTRLDLLKGGRDADPRQQTLRATIEWSYDLLSREERDLFAALSIFSGGSTLEAAEYVSRADLDALGSLVDKSLVRRSGDRYWMLETIAEFARERLVESGESETAAARHLDYFLRLAREAALGLRGTGQADWLARLDADLDNFRQALGRAELLRRTETGLEIANGLARFWEARGYWVEAARRFRGLLDASAGSATGARAEALFWLGRVSVFTGRWNQGHELFLEAAALSRELGRQDMVALALGKASWSTNASGRQNEARAFADEGLAIARALGDDRILAEAMNSLAVVVVQQHDFEFGAAMTLESLALRRKLGDGQNVIDSLNNLGNIRMFTGRLEEAAKLFDECIELARGLGEMRQLVLALANRAMVQIIAGELDGVAELLREDAELSLRCGDRRIGGGALHMLAVLEVSRGDMQKAARLWGAGDELQGYPVDLDRELMRERWLSKAEGSLGAARFELEYRLGTQLPFEDAVAYALQRDDRDL